MTHLSRYTVALSGDGTDAITVSAIFSDDSVGRDGNIFVTKGMEITAFQKNPTVPYAHATDEPPVGKVTSLTKDSRQLRGSILFTPAELYPFGAMVGRMYESGFLNAFSVSILPLEMKYTSDKARAGGMDITKSELLEISAVPVPALATALVTARSRGLDIAPARAWAERRLDLRVGGPSAIADLCKIRKAAMSPSRYAGRSI
jgi:hypothetical protein